MDNRPITGLFFFGLQEVDTVVCVVGNFTLETRRGEDG